MAANSRAVSVTTTATRLDSTAQASARNQSLALYNAGEVAVYIGGPGVTTANGTPIAPTSYGPSFDLTAGDELYGIVSSGTAEVRVLEVGV